jgi:cell division control protein 24
MADPLSIAATIAGLVGTTTKISITVVGVTSAIADAPRAARMTLETAQEMEYALIAVQQLIDSVASLPSERKLLVRLDHIAIVLTNCVFGLSELEALVCGDLVKNGGLMNRIRWAWGEKKILRLLSRVESQKTCLVLMTSILQS